MFEDDGYRKARIATLIAFLLNGFSVGTFISRIPDFKNILNISNSLLGTSLFCASAGVLAALRPTSKLAAKYGGMAKEGKVGPSGERLLFLDDCFF